MGQVLTPIDWGIVPRSFHVVVQARPTEPPLELRVVALDAFVAAGLNAHVLYELACAQSKYASVRHCVVPACPDDGKYVLILGEAGNVAADAKFSGVQVSARHGWSPRNAHLPKRLVSRRTARPLGTV